MPEPKPTPADDPSVGRSEPNVLRRRLQRQLASNCVTVKRHTKGKRKSSLGSSIAPYKTYDFFRKTQNREDENYLIGSYHVTFLAASAIQGRR